jgi:CheY-like chemotaxis protein
MGPRVLVADDDLNAHQILRDVLEISLHNVHIDKALDGPSFLKKIRSGHTYDLLLLDYDLNDKAGGAHPVTTLQGEFPELARRTILMNVTAKDQADDSRVAAMPSVHKPFSLDVLSDMVKKTCRSR